MACPDCGCEHQETIVMAEGMHYAKLVCGDPDCGRFFRWLPRPKRPWRDLELPAPDVKPGTLAELVGTEAQVAYAAKIRPIRLRAVYLMGEEYRPLALAMATISDASWWISQKDRSVEDTSWPASWPSKDQGDQRVA